MAAPAVQGLDQIIAELNPAFQQSTDVLAQRKAGIAPKYDAQRSGLEAARVQGFNTINNQATNRGLSFSGIPLDEQATYLSTQYLPGQQAANAAQNSDELQLDQALADLNLTKSNQAMQIRQTQQSSLDQYLAQEAQRQFEAQQNALNRSAQAASSRAAETGPTAQQYLIGAFENGTDDWRKAGYTEKNVLNQYAAAYGKTIQDAAKEVYSFRKQYYGF